MRRMITANELKKAGALTVEALEEVLEGSDSVVVDVNEEGDKLQVRLDQSQIIPEAPAEGSYHLASIDGVIQWVVLE